MKLLHTADLHLGQTFHSFDRRTEQQACLEYIEDIIRREKPDAYLISGDVYHTIAPQMAAQEMLLKHLLNVHGISPDTRIVVTAGNHDSNSIEISDPLWNIVGVSVIASIKRNIIQGEDNSEYHQELFDRHIIEVRSGSALKGFIVALPHCYPGNFPSVEDGLAKEERQKKFIQMLLDETARRNTGGVPVVLMAHLAVRKTSGADPDAFGQDLDIIGGIDMVDADVLGEGYDYAALGHIHYPQDISERIRYCGSPLPTSFDEDYVHSVSLVEIGRHGDIPRTEAIPVVNLMPVITIPERDRDTGNDATADDNTDPARSLPWEEARKRLEDFPADRPGYLRLNVTDDGTIPADAKDIAAKIAAQRNLKARFCLINRVRKDDGAQQKRTSRTQLSAAQLGQMSPMQVAGLFYRETMGTEMPQELKEMLESVIRQTGKQTEQ